MRKKTRRLRIIKQNSNLPRCGLCGSTTNLTKTPCCDNWICDDADEYVIFSYEHNSCYRNHNHYTLCGVHYNEEHKGHWQECKECRKHIETELYVDYGTNDYNFEKLKNIPKFKPTRCSSCNNIIDLSEGGYFIKGKEYICYDCTNDEEKKAIEMFNNLSQ